MLPPVVYLGPSLDSTAAERLLPYAQMMPPVRRGDLYRDRLLGFKVFLILDGIFLHQAAVSPREIVDILEDGATVLGAASMGAIRAAECWPAGMRGVGSIYRMYRRGSLTCDDEVAVAFKPERPYAPTTLPLVNVRYAVSRALRGRLLSYSDATRIVEAASEQFYAERDWPSILKAARVAFDGKLLRTLAAFDLKRMDAVRALRRLHCWLEQSPNLLTDTGPAGRRFLRRGTREVAPHGFLDLQRDLDMSEVWSWLLFTGRYRRYAVKATLPSDRQPPPADASTAASSHIPESIHGDSRDGARAGPMSTVAADRELAMLLADGRTSGGAIESLRRHDGVGALAIWSHIEAAGEKNALLMRFIATREAATWARARGLRPESRHHSSARAEIAVNHGFATWEAMRVRFQAQRGIWAAVTSWGRVTALAKKARHELFGGAPPAGPGLAGAGS
jgi:hypothetical protein